MVRRYRESSVLEKRGPATLSGSSRSLWGSMNGVFEGLSYVGVAQLLFIPWNSWIIWNIYWEQGLKTLNTMYRLHWFMRCLYFISVFFPWISSPTLKPWAFDWLPPASACDSWSSACCRSCRNRQEGQGQMQVVPRWSCRYNLELLNLNPL